MLTDEDKIKLLTEKLNKKLNRQEEELEPEEQASEIIKEHKRAEKKEIKKRIIKEEEKIEENITSDFKEVPEGKIVKYIIFVLILGGIFIGYHMILGKSKEEKYGLGVERVYKNITNSKIQIKEKSTDIYNGVVKDVEKEMEIIEKQIPINNMGEEIKLKENGAHVERESSGEKDKAEVKEGLDIREEERTQTVKEAQELLNLEGENKLGDGLK